MTVTEYSLQGHLLLSLDRTEVGEANDGGGGGGGGDSNRPKRIKHSPKNQIIWWNLSTNASVSYQVAAGPYIEAQRL